jgi:hypothetical protein
VENLRRARGAGTDPLDDRHADFAQTLGEKRPEIEKRASLTVDEITYLTPASVLPLVRARYGAHARGWTSQSRQNAR